MQATFLEKKKIDALLISKKENIAYLTNFRGSFGYVLLEKRSIKLFTDSRYLAETKKIVLKNVKVYDYTKLKTALKTKIIGYEGQNITVSQFKKWKKQFPQTNFKLIENFIEEDRISKKESELEKIQKAAQINDKILTKIKQEIKIGISENELQWKIRKMAHSYGADKMSFKTIVNFGKNSAHPHHHADKTKLKYGDLILIDMGVSFQNYCSDITRVFFTKIPTKKQKEVFQIVKKAQTKAIKKVSQTPNCAKIDATARKYIAEKKYGNYFGHSLGHGVGIEIHESPNLSPLSKEKLRENSIFTIEPGIYLPGKFGIRIEDLFVYKEKKAVRLSQFTRKIEELVLSL